MGNEEQLQRLYSYEMTKGLPLQKCIHDGQLTMLFLQVVDPADRSAAIDLAKAVEGGKFKGVQIGNVEAEGH